MQSPRRRGGKTQRDAAEHCRDRQVEREAHRRRPVQPNEQAANYCGCRTGHAREKSRNLRNTDAQCALYVNLLQRDICPSGTKFESEITAMVAHILNGEAVKQHNPGDEAFVEKDVQKALGIGAATTPAPAATLKPLIDRVRDWSRWRRRDRSDRSIHEHVQVRRRRPRAPR